MKSPVRSLIIGALSIGVLGLAVPSQGEGVARLRPVRIKNVDEPGRAPYQASGLFLPSSCSFNSVLYFCPLSFPAVPKDKRLVIEHITMFVAVNGGSPDSLRFRTPLNGTAFWVQPTFTPRAGVDGHFFLDRPVLVYQEADTTPNLLLALTAPLLSAEMTVHGYLIDAVN